MFVISYEQTVNDVTSLHHVQVSHTDGTSPVSICQALRLVREEFVRQRVEDSVFITRAKYYKAGDIRLRWVNHLVSTKGAC